MFSQLLVVHLLVSLVFCSLVTADAKYTPDWQSLDSRPLPQWYDEGKLGIFCHWGVYSVPSFGSEWFWRNWKLSQNPNYVKFMENNYKPGFSYQDFGPMFTAEFFNATEFADVVKASGAKYFVLTSKHHEGYTMWPSNYSWGWNSVDVGPHRDIIGELRTSFDTMKDVHFGLYYSLYEWFNPTYMKDKSNKFRSQDYVDSIVIPQIKEVVSKYKPDVLWSDGDWEASDAYWKSRQILAWLYNESPVKDSVVTNDRWGKFSDGGRHGGYFSYADRYDPGYLIPHKWEQCMTLDLQSWGHRRRMTASEVMSLQELVARLARTISCNGNILVNIGPTSYGTIPPVFEERLRQLGDFLGINGEAVYATKPWIYQNDTLSGFVWYTSKMRSDDGLDPARIFNPQKRKDTIVYAFVTEWPTDGLLKLGSVNVTDKTKASMLGVEGNTNLPIGINDMSGARIDLTSIPWNKLPSTTAWVIKLEYLEFSGRNPIWELYGYNGFKQ